MTPAILNQETRGEVMNKRDMQRLTKIDEEIHSLQISYERQRQHEILAGTTHLLLSRGIKYRLDRTIKARKLLAKAVAGNPSRKTVFYAELQERKLRLDAAIAELPELLQLQEGAAANLVLDKSPANIVAFKDAEFEVRRQKARITAYERSYTTYSKRGDNIPEKQTRSVLPKEYKASKDVYAIYGQLPIDSTIANAVTQPTRIEDTAFGQSEAYLDERKAVSVVPAGLLDAPIVTQQSEPRKTFTFNEMAAMHAGELQQPRKRPVIG
jgi:hypothetical protein